MRVDDGSADVQPQSKAAESTATRIVIGLVEALEDIRPMLVGDPDPGVADGHLDVATATVNVDGDRPALRRILHRVLEQVAQDLVDPIAIRVDHQRVGSMQRDLAVRVLALAPG